MHDSCVFCEMKPGSIIADTELSLAINDRYPVSRGHTLIMPRRHVASIFELTDSEYTDILSLMRQVKAQHVAEYQPDGWNIGINDGVAAGQTIMHLHLHVIPRYVGDVEDPRGGIRHLFPSRARYWENPQ